MTTLEEVRCHPEVLPMFLLARLLILFCLVSPPALAQTLTSVECAAVFDDNGTRVGKVQEAGMHEANGPAVLFSFDGLIFPARATTPGLTGNARNNRLYYADDNCAGTPFISNWWGIEELVPGFPSALPSTVVDGRTVYIADHTLDPQIVQYQASRDFPPVGDGSCDGVGAGGLVGAEVIQSTDLLPAYTPPFHVEAEPCSGGGATSLPTVSHMGFLTTLIILLVITGAVCLALLRKRSSSAA
jgi:hypothetical protein